MPFYSTRSIELAASAARTSSSVGSAQVVSDLIEARVYVTVTAKAGTSPTLDVTVQDSDDGGTTWYTHTTVTQFTDTGQKAVSLTNFGKTIRVSWTIGGSSPSFTFRITMIGKG